jgi:hypothetical protein
MDGSIATGYQKKVPNHTVIFDLNTEDIDLTVCIC